VGVGSEICINLHLRPTNPPPQVLLASVGPEGFGGCSNQPMSLLTLWVLHMLRGKVEDTLGTEQELRSHGTEASCLHCAGGGGCVRVRVRARWWVGRWRHQPVLYQVRIPGFKASPLSGLTLLEKQVNPAHT
jgi:hypothetical protein